MTETDTREQLEKRRDKLARQYAETDDRKIKSKIEDFSRRLAMWDETLY